MADIGNLFVVAAPSGAGKTSLVKSIIESVEGITVSISHTTRLKRPGEVHGSNYYFVNKTEFQQMIDQHDFLEYAPIFDNLYGTSKSWVEETLAKGIDVILEIDWQGQQQIKQLFPNAISIFILPPSMEDLQDRLVKRNQDPADVIKKRLADAQETVSHIYDFDYVVINDDFITAQQDIASIVKACRLKQKRQTLKYATLIDNLKNITST